MKTAYRFPNKFVWGYAAAAPQIEGAAFEDGKGESIWDKIAHKGGHIHDNDKLDVACDHYHLYKKRLRSHVPVRRETLSLVARVVAHLSARPS